MPKQNDPDVASISLDTVFTAMKHWRNNKHQYEHRGIPDSLWTSLFKLEDSGYSKGELCRLFSLNSPQYDKKRDQLSSTSDANRSQSKKSTDKSGASQNTVTSPFAEVVVTDDAETTEAPPLVSAANKTKQVIKQLKSTDNKPEHYLDNTTVIVECIRDDGHRLKIHLTTCRLDTLIQGFLNYGDVPA